MKSATRLLAAASAMFLATTASQGAIVLNDNFEYADQAAFQASWPALGTAAPLSGELSTAQASSPIKSIRNPGTTVNNQSRNLKTFAETSTVFPLAVGNSITWSFDFFETSFASAPNRNYANLQDSAAPATSPAGQLISMGVNNNQGFADSGGNYYMARILGFSHSAVDPDGGPNELAAGTTSGAYFKLNDPGAPLRSAGWHNLKVVISTDNAAQGADLKFYVDNTLAETISNLGDATTLRSYDQIRMGSGLGNGNQEVFFDNMFLEVVPEPGSLAILGLGGLSLLARRRRMA